MRTGSSDRNSYSPSIVAAISVLCVIVSLFVGFLLGLFVSRITCSVTHTLPVLRSSQVDARSWRSMPPKDFSFESERVVHQNAYDVEPGKTFGTFRPNRMKQQNTPGQNNIFVNDLKPNNSKLANGSTAETSLYPRRGVYL